MNMAHWDMLLQNASVRLRKGRIFLLHILVSWGGCRWKAIYFHSGLLFGNALICLNWLQGVMLLNLMFMIFIRIIF